MRRLCTYISWGVLSASSVLCPIIARAQNATISEESQGVLGKRYAEVNFNIGRPSEINDNVYGTAIGANVPVTSFLDISGSYAYEWYKIDHNSTYQKTNIQDIGTNFVFYKQMAYGLKPFVAARLGYSWVASEIELNSPYYGFLKDKIRDDAGHWTISAGVEIAFSCLALKPTVTYSDDFKKSWESAQSWSYGLEANSWITPKVGIYADVAYSKPQHDINGSHMWSYGAGLRVRF